MFYHGNVTQDEALNLAKLVEEKIKPKPLARYEVPFKRVVQLEQGNPSRMFVLLGIGVTYVSSLQEPNPDNENSAITMWYQVGTEADLQLVALLDLVGDILKDRCYHQLRTQQQLG